MVLEMTDGRLVELGPKEDNALDFGQVGRIAINTLLFALPSALSITVTSSVNGAIFTPASRPLRRSSSMTARCAPCTWQTALRCLWTSRGTWAQTHASWCHLTGAMYRVEAERFVSWHLRPSRPARSAGTKSHVR